MTTGGRAATAGRLVFLPWVCLPHPVVVGGFRFVPVKTADLAPVIGDQIAETAAMAIQTHVDQRGKPIEACTLVLRRRGHSAWAIPERLWSTSQRATEILALACLSEQRFFEGHFAPHLNATMFRLIGQGIRAGDDGIGLTYRRRGSTLQVGGYKFADVVFQQPLQVENTACEVVNARLIRALRRARRREHSAWEAITASIELFLLGHTEAFELLPDTCAMVSAMAFERLLKPEGDCNARTLAKALAKLWEPYADRAISQAERVKPDPKYSLDQQPWPLHRKWMKELYEARSAKAHQGKRDDFSMNWTQTQHVVISAFVYPLAIKLMLGAAGLYAMSEQEVAACGALDALLDGGWDLDELGRPKWSEILSEHEGARAMDRIVRKSMAKAGW